MSGLTVANWEPVISFVGVVALLGTALVIVWARLAKKERQHDDLEEYHRKYAERKSQQFLDLHERDIKILEEVAKTNAQTAGALVDLNKALERTLAKCERALEK